MITESKLRELLDDNVPESSTLDFKRDIYRLDAEHFKSLFIKDILSMANTPREETSYIIIGVKVNSTGIKTLVGVSGDHPDDADLHQLLNLAKVQPKPEFSYQPIRLGNLSYGVIEIPLKKDGPYLPTRNFGVLKSNVLYFRSGSMNEEALPHKQKEVYEWFISIKIAAEKAAAMTNFNQPEQRIGGNQYNGDKQYFANRDINIHKYRTPSPGTNKQSRSRNKASLTVLFLAANPKDTSPLRLDEEAREIDRILRQTEFRDTFDIKQHWAVRVADLQSYLLRHKPDIVHFSGHGSSSSEIILENISGQSHPITPHALSQVFSILKDNIRCVILNACYSEQQAQAIAQHIECVVGMSNAIGDRSAISFATAFYQALGYGRSVKTAFDLGCAQIDLENLEEQDIPKLLALKSNPADIVFVNDNE